MSPAIGVTGVTGGLGGAVARRLAEAGVEQRLVARRPERAPRLSGSTVVQAEYADRDAVRRALAGLDVVLMVSAGETQHRVDVHRAFVDAAVEAGVRHLVYTSFLAAAPDATFTLGRDHHATERHIEASLPTWTLVRDNFYADVFPLFADQDGVVRGPAGNGRVSALARDDAAAVLAAVLLDPAAHEGRAYDLTGPEALTVGEITDTMSRVLGRRYTFLDETVEEAYASRAAYGAPDWQLDAWVSTYTAIASGELARVTGEVERLTGRPATPIAELLAR